ncbi:N-formylglutamate amidohydrolase [Sulfitobacter geojensis]|uniref:N-formylglutamate amidohydrolase n=1 Tax=Sulfitobacter geojensis TaxID=1342299 RepID=UPI0036DEC9A2
MNQTQQNVSDSVVEVVNPDGSSPVVLVCEHASPAIPAPFNNLGLTGDALSSHAAWDPGAMTVARIIAQELDAVLVASRVSRLVYDCNRPPEAAGAMPAKSEVFDIPGNANLTPAERAARTAAYYTPFRDTLARVIAAAPSPVIVTIHSFTPIYHGAQRAVEIGILHDSDTRLADAMLDTAAAHSPHLTQRNAPYGPQDGVTHTLLEHGISGGHPNVMIEIRNDLIQTPDTQRSIALQLAGWLTDACATVTGENACKA